VKPRWTRAIWRFICSPRKISVRHTAPCRWPILC